MDGAWADVKLDQIKQRHSKTLIKLKNLTDKIDLKGLCNFQPAFALKCFSDALAEIEGDDSTSKMVEIITAPFEADNAVAREATERRCPVLTEDSDMIVFNLPLGYIKLSTLKWEEIQTDLKYVKCKRVMSIDVAMALGIDVNRLRLFATLKNCIKYNKLRHGPNISKDKTVFSEISNIVQKYSNDDDETALKKIDRDFGSCDLEKMLKTYKSYNLQDEQVNPPDRIRNLLDGGKLYHGALVVWLQGDVYSEETSRGFQETKQQ